MCSLFYFLRDEGCFYSWPVLELLKLVVHLWLINFDNTWLILLCIPKNQALQQRQDFISRLDFYPQAQFKL